MNNETILQSRWKNTDIKLKEYLLKYTKLNRKTQDKIQDIFNDVDFSFNELNKPITTTRRKRLLRTVEQWRDDGLLVGYFEYVVNNLLSKRIITNEELLEVLLWGVYIEERSKLDEFEKNLFTEVGQDLYTQGIEEINPKKKKNYSLTWEYIWSLLTLPSSKGNKWITYVEALALTNSQEIKKQAIIQLQQDKDLTVDDDIFKNILRKQRNRYLSINDDKISGALESKIEEIGNKAIAKSEEDIGNKDLKARFIAVIDERTTKMCRGMNNMLFNVNDLNKFYRYSDEDKKDIYYEVKGLQVGINLPPISNHFHYCRSTITYQLEESIANEVRDSIKVSNEYDKEQYYRYKKLLDNNFPYANVEDFTKMKYNNPSEWNKLKSLYRNKKEVEKFKDKYSKIKHNENGYIVDTNVWTSHQSIPKEYRPNAVIKSVTKSKNGTESISRNIYDDNARLVKQIHNDNHGFPKAHPYGVNGEHIHEFIWENNKIVNRTTRELNEIERKENGDII